MVLGASILVACAVAAAVASAVARWNRRRATDARAMRAAVVTELERDPALADLSLSLQTRLAWSGEAVVEVAGVVPSPWYRYAVIRAAQRALRRTYREAHIIDHIVIERAPLVRHRRTA